MRINMLHTSDKSLYKAHCLKIFIILHLKNVSLKQNIN